jgi:uncharacterized membrane protein
MKFPKFIKYFLAFVLFSFLGFIIEYIYGCIVGDPFLYDKFFYDQFRLFLPFIPIYGLGGMILLFLAGYMEKKKIKFAYRGLINALIITIWEFIGGIFTYLFLSKIYWDYSSHFLNLTFISLQVFIMWLVAGYLFSWVYSIAIKNKKIKKFIL